MKLKFFFTISAFFILASCSSVQRTTATSGEISDQASLENKTALPQWAKEELHVNESTLGVTARIEISQDQSPVQGLILADAKAQELFKKQLSSKLYTWLLALNKNPHITGPTLKIFTENLINNDLDSVLLIDKHYYNQTESHYQCYSLATLNASELKQKISEKINKDFKDAQSLLKDLEASWNQFLASLPIG